MAYHMARILHREFGYQGIGVSTGEPPLPPIFDYDPVFPSITVDEMVATITDDDVLIANPAASNFHLGLRCRGRKIMYIQHFNTFSLLDCRFDLYVSVSEIVRRVISATYGIETAVIPPFIQAERFPPAPPWRERPPRSILVSLKWDMALQHLLLDRLRTLVAPSIALNDVLQGKLSQGELLARIGGSRHFLTLSVAEGFGLMPLEAMAMGTTVLGFDGYGGRDYMQPGINAGVAAYPDVEGLAKQIAEIIEDPVRGEAMAEAGRAMARAPLYTYERFRTDWVEQFRRMFG